MAIALTACNRRTVYHHYEHTPVSGWEKNDTLVFYTDPMQDDGHYIEEIGLRINGSYPFMGLNLIIEQTVYPSKDTRSDTLNCTLIDEQGYPKGRGISHYQNLFHLTTLKLNRGESLHIAIRHDMKREILPGISDIGIRLRKADKN